MGASVLMHTDYKDLDYLEIRKHTTIVTIREEIITGKIQQREDQTMNKQDQIQNLQW